MAESDILTSTNRDNIKMETDVNVPGTDLDDQNQASSQTDSVVDEARTNTGILNEITNTPTPPMTEGAKAVVAADGDTRDERVANGRIDILIEAVARAVSSRASTTAVEDTPVSVSVKLEPDVPTTDVKIETAVEPVVDRLAEEALMTEDESMSEGNSRTTADIPTAVLSPSMISEDGSAIDKPDNSASQITEDTVHSQATSNTFSDLINTAESTNPSSEDSSISGSMVAPETPNSGRTLRKRKPSVSLTNSSVRSSLSHDIVVKKEEPEVVRKAILVTPKVKKSASAKKKKSPETYEANTYPLELLAKDAFILTNEVGAPVCRYCLNSKYEPVDGTEKDPRLLKCVGECRRYFHVQCLNNDGQNDIDISVEYKCVECTTGLRKCFTCKEKGTDLTKCPDKDCGEFYHMTCLTGPQTAGASPKKLPRCPVHHCHTCARVGRQRKSKKERLLVLSRCRDCPVAYHFNIMCMPADMTVCVDNPQFAQCHRHLPQSVDTTKKSAKKGNVSFRSGIKCTSCLTCKKANKVLIHCATCPFTSDVECAQLDDKHPEDWRCPDCVKGYRPRILHVVWFKFGYHRVWPCQIVPEAVVPESVRRRKPADKAFFLRYLGTTDYGFANANEVLPWEISELKWKQNPKEKYFEEGLIEAKAINHGVQRLETEQVAKFFTGPTPEYTKIRSNKAIHPAKYITSVRREDAHECNCAPDSINPCGPDTGCLNRDVAYECSKYCAAGDKCQNRRIRNHEYPKMEIFYTADRGWALRILEDRKKGDLIVEYVGEIITVAERNKRIKNKQATGDRNFYFLDLTNARVIDAGPSGNLARFANHSCDANTFSQKWDVDGDTHIALIATRDIKKGDEITFDYRWEYEAGITSRECLCGAANCPGMIGGKTYEPSRGKQLPSEPQKPRRSSVSPGRKRARKSSTTVAGLTPPQGTPEPSQKRQKRGRPSGKRGPVTPSTPPSATVMSSEPAAPAPAQLEVVPAVNSSDQVSVAEVSSSTSTPPDEKAEPMNEG